MPKIAKHVGDANVERGTFTLGADIGHEAKVTK
jgi:hypothetical protein